jgi:hypothetical protein
MTQEELNKSNIINIGKTFEEVRLLHARQDFIYFAKNFYYEQKDFLRGTKAKLIITDDPLNEE